LFAAAFYRFWDEKDPQIHNLMNQRNLGGWIAAAIEKPVSYQTLFFQTLQETMTKETIIVWVYDSLKQKRSQVSLPNYAFHQERPHAPLREHALRISKTRKMLPLLTM
jgi:hypothetical protein